MSSYTISGGARWHMLSQIWGAIVFGATTVTLTGTPNFSAAFCMVYTGLISWYFPSFSGSATGKQYEADFNGVINTYSGVTLPGDSAGTTFLGGVKN